MSSEATIYFQGKIFNHENGETMALVLAFSFLKDEKYYLVGFELDVESLGLDMKLGGEPVQCFDIDLSELEFQIYPCFITEKEFILRDFESDEERQEVEAYYTQNFAMAIFGDVFSRIACSLN